MRLVALFVASTLTVASAAAASDTARDLHLYGGIGALTASAVMFGFAYSDTRAVAASHDDADVQAYRSRWPASEGDTCARAREGQEGPGGQSAARPLAAYVASACSDVQTKQTRQYWLWGGGFALATAGIVLLVTRPSKSASTTSAHIAPLAGPTFGGLSLRLTF